jgi:hypothetical protein
MTLCAPKELCHAANPLTLLPLNKPEHGDD